MNTEQSAALLARLKEIREYVARCRASGREEPGAPAHFYLTDGICAAARFTIPGVLDWLRVFDCRRGSSRLR